MIPAKGDTVDLGEGEPPALVGVDNVGELITRGSKIRLILPLRPLRDGSAEWVYYSLVIVEGGVTTRGLVSLDLDGRGAVALRRDNTLYRHI